MSWDDQTYDTTDGFMTEPQMVFVRYEEFVSNPFDGKNSAVEREEEQPVFWAIESESAVRFSHGGKLLKDGGEHNDYYGFLKSVDGAIEEFDKASEHFSVTQKSTMTLSLHTRLVATPTLGFPLEGDPVFKEYENGKRYGSRIVLRYPRRTWHVKSNRSMEQIKLPSVEVFNSKMSVKQREKAAAAYVEKHQDAVFLNALRPADHLKSWEE